MVSNKLTITEEMKAIDCRKFEWWGSLTEAEQKKVNMWVLMRFASSVASPSNDITEHYVTMMNEFVNVNFNIMRHHPELQHRLMQIVGIGSQQSHPWIAPPKQKKGKTQNATLVNFILQLHPFLSDTEIDMFISMTGKEELKAKLIEAGFVNKEIKEMLK